MSFNRYRLIELRKEKNLTQKVLAEKAGIGLASIKGYEAGIREPTEAMLKRLANFFGVYPDYLKGHGYKDYYEELKATNPIQADFMVREEKLLDLRSTITELYLSDFPKGKYEDVLKKVSKPLPEHLKNLHGDDFFDEYFKYYRSIHSILTSEEDKLLSEYYEAEDILFDEIFNNIKLSVDKFKKRIEDE